MKYQVYQHNNRYASVLIDEFYAESELQAMQQMRFFPWEDRIAKENYTQATFFTLVAKPVPIKIFQMNSTLEFD